MELIALAIAPGLAICLFIFHRDAFNREPKLTLLITFLLGILSTAPAYFIETALRSVFDNSILGTAALAFLVVALTEELCKFAALRGYAYRRPSFDEPFDGIVHGVMASMGFATLENILYVMRSAESGNGYQVAILRMFLSVPAHATFGILMGYFAGKAKFEPARENTLLARGVLWAVFFHGSYDTFLFWQGSPDMKGILPDLLLFAGAVTSFIVALRMSLKQIRIHRRLSQRMHRPGSGLAIRVAGIPDIPLIQGLAMQVWPQTYAPIISPEQIEYMLERMYSASSLERQMRDRHEFIIVTDHEEPVGFASIGPPESGTYKLHKIYILPSMQGKGAGAYVIGELMKAIARNGGRTLQLNVNRNNPARGFYERMGFSVIREEDIDIGQNFYMNDYVMERTVQNAVG